METTSKTFRAAALARVKAEAGASFSEETFKKAYAKAQRHMRAKYGSGPSMYVHEMDESGTDNVSYFYVETIRVPDGGRTFNRNCALAR